MASTGICFSTNARDEMLDGATVLDDAVRVTLGPHSRSESTCT